MKQTVCITGGSGGIGRALLERLTELYHVKALFRTRTTTTEYWERRGCRAVWGNLANEEALAALVAGATHVFHCAAAMSGSYADAYAVNVDGTLRLARAAARHGCQRFVHVSSVAVYSGTHLDGDCTEDVELRDNPEMAVYSRTKLQGEKALEDVASETGLEYTILRPTSVYGPHTKPYTEIPIALIRKGVPVVLGDGTGMLDAVYVEDLVAALLLAAHSPHACGEAFNVGHELVTLKRFYGHYADMLKRRAKHLPTSVLRGIVRLLRLLPSGRAAGLHDVRRGVEFLLAVAGNSRHFPSAKAARLLGYEPRFTLATGMLKTELWAKRTSLVERADSRLEDYGPLPFRPLALVHPSTEREIVQIVRMALEADVKAKAIGSLHSLSPIPETEGICLVLDNYAGLVNVSGQLVTVQGGMKLRSLNEALAAVNLALPTSGSITEQTIAGAIATATHGGSIHHGSISDYVEAVRIVRADGSVVNVDRSHELFGAVVVSMGLLGITSTVTLRCVPSHVLRSSTCVRTVQEVIDNFEDLTRRALHTNMFYFPVMDQIEMLSIEKVESADGHVVVQTDPPAKPAWARPRVFPARARQSVARVALKGLAWLVSRDTSTLRFFTRFSLGSAYRPRTGRSDVVLAILDVGTSDRSSAMLRDMEAAVPYEHAREALTALRNHFLTTQRFPLLPIHVRCAARSDLWLNPAYKRDVCWFEFWQYPRTDRLFEQIHELLKPFGYRFHWGKETRADRGYIRQQYARWDDFVRLRQQWDPTGMFLNPYLESFFGRNESPAGSEIARGEMVRDERAAARGDGHHGQRRVLPS